MTDLNSKYSSKDYFVAINKFGEVLYWAGLGRTESSVKRYMLTKTHPDETSKYLNYRYGRSVIINRLWDKYFGVNGMKVISFKMLENIKDGNANA
jgi:hypothetical protein